jgi:hypothetical protein
LNPAFVYDYTLRCAIHACLEDQSKQKLAPANKDQKQSNRHSVHLSGVGDVFGNIADKITGDENVSKDKLTKPVVVALMRRLDDIKDGKDVAKPEYLDRRFISIVRQVRDVVKQHRYRPQGSINDLVITFLRTSETELKKTDPNPAVWFKDLDKYVVLFTEVLLIVLKEDAPNSASQDLIDTLSKSVIPKQQQKKQPASRNTTNNSDTPAKDILEIIENFPMVQTVQNLFQIENSIHRQKIRELHPVCTEAVTRAKKQKINYFY